MLIQTISPLELILYYGDSFPAIIKYYCKQMHQGDLLYVIKDSNDQTKAVGATIVRKSTNLEEMELVYIYIDSEYRDKGYGSKLFEALIDELAKKNIKTLYGRTMMKDKNLLNIFHKWGFKTDNESVVIKCNIDPENAEKWEKYANRRNSAIQKWNEINGIETISFSQADKSMLEYIYDMQNNDFPNELNAAVIASGVCGRVVPELSFISYKDNTPIAYTMVTQADKNSLVFSHISTSEKWKGTGVFSGAFFRSMEEIIKSKYKTVSYAVMAGNKVMLGLVSSMISFLTLKEERQIYWYKSIKEER